MLKGGMYLINEHRSSTLVGNYNFGWGCVFLGHIRGLKTVVGWLATLIMQLHARHPFP